MRTPRRIEANVFWLSEDSATTAAHLREKANARDLEPQRQILADRMRSAGHARVDHADLGRLRKRPPLFDVAHIVPHIRPPALPERHCGGGATLQNAQRASITTKA